MVPLCKPTKPDQGRNTNVAKLPWPFLRPWLGCTRYSLLILKEKCLFHCDPTPSNILKSGGTFKLGDLGTSCSSDGPARFHPYYKPPEGVPGAAADIYVFGFTLCFLCAQWQPTKSGDRPSEAVVAKLNESPLGQLALKCIEVDHQARPSVREALALMNAPPLDSQSRGSADIKP